MVGDTPGAYVRCLIAYDNPAHRGPYSSPIHVGAPSPTLDRDSLRAFRTISPLFRRPHYLPFRTNGVWGVALNVERGPDESYVSDVKVKVPYKDVVSRRCGGKIPSKEGP